MRDAGPTIREERPFDHAAIHAVNTAAFDTPAEADLVDTLRTRAVPYVSLVAELDGEIAGHILFTPVTLTDPPGLVMGLAPLAVRPDRQRQGVGAALVREGLTRLRQLGAIAVVVLGHPDYYPRFGFEAASRFGIRSEYDVPEDAFMLIELVPGSLDGVHGTARYHPAFAAV